MPKKEKKSNKLRKYLLGAGAVGLTGLGAYKLLKNKGVRNIVSNSPVEKNVQKLAKQFDLPKKDVVEEISKTRKNLNVNLEQAGKLTKRQSSSLSNVNKVTSELVDKTRKPLNVNFDPKGDLSNKVETRLQKFLRKSRRKSNLRNATRLRGNSTLPSRAFDRMQKLKATIDDAKAQNILDGINVKGSLPPAKPTLGEVLPKVQNKVTSQKLLPQGKALPKVNQQYSRITVKPFYRKGKLVNSYKRNMLTNVRQQKLQQIRNSRIQNIAQNLKSNQILNDQTLRDRLSPQIKQLDTYLKSAKIKRDTPFTNKLKVRIKPDNPTELTAKKLKILGDDELYAKQEVVKQTQEALDKVKNKAIHIKTELDDIDYISQQAREKIRYTRDIRRTKRYQIEFQPERRSQILESLNDQINASKRYARNLDKQARSKLTKSKNIEDTYNEIKQELKDVTVPTFSRNLETISNDVKLDNFKRDFDDYLDNPFSEVDHFKNVDELKGINSQIDTELAWANAQLKEPRKRLTKVKDGLKRIDLLRKRYDNYLTEATKLNSDGLTKINLTADNVLDDLAKIEVDDVGEEFFKNELPTIRKSLESLRNGDSKTYTSPFLKNLDDYELKLKNLEASFDKRITSKDYKQVTDYISKLNEQKLKLQELPLTQRKLTTSQKSRLKSTELKRKEFNNLVKGFDSTKLDYARWRDTFGSKFDTIESDIKSISKDVDSGSLLEYHMKNVDEHTSKMLDDFSKAKQQLQLLDKVTNPESYLDYFDGGIVRNSDKVTLSEMMNEKRKMLNVTKEKFVQEPSLFDRLQGYRKSENKKINGSLEYLAYAIKRMEEPLKYDSDIISLVNTRKRLQTKISSIKKLRKEYITGQTQILEQLEKNYDEVITANPQYKDILDRKLESLRKGIRDDATTYDKFLKLSELQARNSIEIIKTYEDIRPIYTISKAPKTDQITEGLTVKGKSSPTSDSFYDVDLRAEINPYILSQRRAKDGIPTYGRKYKKRQEVDQSSLKNWITEAESKIANYKNVNKRTMVSELYWDMQNNKIKTEGVDNIFENIRSGNLTDLEKLYLDRVDVKYKPVLLDFAKSGQEEAFQTFYYRNTIRKYLLNLQTNNLKLLPEAIQKDVLSKNTKTIFDKTSDIFDKIIGADSGKNSKHLGMIGRKRNEVIDTVNELNRVMKSYNPDNTNDVVKSLVEKGSKADVPKVNEIKLTPFMKFNDEHISLNGRLAVENLPRLYPEKSSQYKYMNTLLRKLYKLLGVNEDGSPIVDEQLVQLLSGNNVKSYDDLQRLVKQLNSELYDKVSLNTLLTANRVNYDKLRESSADLYLYNFSRNKDCVANFSTGSW